MYAFRLNSEHKETFNGGSVVCSALGHTFDVGKALKENDGVIITNSEFLGEALSRYDALERVPENELPKDPRPITVPGEGQSLTAEELSSQETAPRGDGEIPAEHEEEPSSEDEALAVGERVSGTASSGTARRTGGK